MNVALLCADGKIGYRGKRPTRADILLEVSFTYLHLLACQRLLTVLVASHMYHVHVHVLNMYHFFLETEHILLI